MTSAEEEQSKPGPTAIWRGNLNVGQDAKRWLESGGGSPILIGGPHVLLPSLAVHDQPADGARHRTRGPAAASPYFFFPATAGGGLLLFQVAR